MKQPPCGTACGAHGTAESQQFPPLRPCGLAEKSHRYRTRHARLTWSRGSALKKRGTELLGLPLPTEEGTDFLLCSVGKTVRSRQEVDLVELR